MRFIARIKQPKPITSYWTVRIAVHYDVGCNKFFSDVRYGSKAKALAAAKQLRDKHEAYLLANYEVPLRDGYFGKGWCEVHGWGRKIKNGVEVGYPFHVIVSSIRKEVNRKQVFYKRRQWSITKWGLEVAIREAEAWNAETRKKYNL